METCYRHPERETGVSCSNCGRAICPDCMTSTSVGMRCPECSRQRTKVKTMGSVTEPVLTYALIGVNVLIWLAFAAAPGAGVYSDLALSRFGVASGDYWQLITSGFLHARLGEPYGFVHILSNMFSLYVLGSLLEPAVGRRRLAVLFFVSLLAGSFGALLVEPAKATVGASGAVFGLMGAAVVVMRDRGINPMESGLGLWIGLNLLITFTIPNISIGGHIGGLIGGALAALVMTDLRERLRSSEPVLLLLAASIGVVAVAGAIAVSGSAG